MNIDLELIIHLIMFVVAFCVMAICFLGDS